MERRSLDGSCMVMIYDRWTYKRYFTNEIHDRWSQIVPSEAVMLKFLHVFLLSQLILNISYSQSSKTHVAVIRRGRRKRPL